MPHRERLMLRLVALFGATMLLAAGCSGGSPRSGPATTTIAGPTPASTHVSRRPPTQAPTSMTAVASIGTWTTLPAAPVPALSTLAGVWDGTELLVVGEAISIGTNSAEQRTGSAAAYNPKTRTWWQLATPSGPRASVEGAPKAVWTGGEMIVWGGNFLDAYRPATNTWRRLPVINDLPGGSGFAMVWTGRALVMYGGGCCGGPSAAAASFDPVTNRWTRLTTSLLGARWTSGAWTGTDVVIAGGSGPAEAGTPADGPGEIVTLSETAAYRPATGTWRRLGSLPTPINGTALWDGAQVLGLGQGGAAAWTPLTGAWTKLPAGFDQRIGSGMVWTGRQVLIWGGMVAQPGGGGMVAPSHGLAFAPSTGVWSSLPISPLRGRSGPVTVWTGSQLLVWGGSGLSDGAAYTP